MAEFKNIRIKMKGGKSRLQRVKVLASGKYKFVKNKSRSSSVTKRKVKKTKRRKYSLVRRRRKGRRSRKFTIPLAPVAGLAAGLSYPIALAMDGQYENAMNEIAFRYTGYHVDQGAWSSDGLMKGLVPLIIGGLVHKFVGGNPININKMLAAANVPLIRI